MPSELETKIAELEARLDRLENADQVPPDVATALGLALSGVGTTLKIQEQQAADNGELVSNYDRTVDEGGSGSYQVAGVYDGMITVDGNKMIGYYDKV
jgi:hypothetical protein